MTAAPTLPIPNTPSAVPWCSRSNQRDTNAMPTANEPPASPTPRAASRNIGYVPTVESIQVAAAVTAISSVYTARPPYWSVQIPRKMRLSEPVRIGVATRMPNSVSLSPRSCSMRIPMMEKMVQTAKQTVNAKVLRPRAWCRRRAGTPSRACIVPLSAIAVTAGPREEAAGARRHQPRGPPPAARAGTAAIKPEGAAVCLDLNQKVGVAIRRIGPRHGACGGVPRSGSEASFPGGEIPRGRRALEADPGRQARSAVIGASRRRFL